MQYYSFIISHLTHPALRARPRRMSVWSHHCPCYTTSGSRAGRTRRMASVDEKAPYREDQQVVNVCRQSSMGKSSMANNSSDLSVIVTRSLQSNRRYCITGSCTLWPRCSGIPPARSPAPPPVTLNNPGSFLESRISLVHFVTTEPILAIYFAVFRQWRKISFPRRYIF